jgi:formylglycine-generating enzyme required for sulfatase activity
MNYRAHISIVVFCGVFLTAPVLADCPSMDATGDCRVDMKDLAVFARQWLGGDGIPDDMVAIPGGTFVMGDFFNDQYAWGEIPLHTVTLDPFYMSKYEITNGQYCEFLNATRTKIVDGFVYGPSDEEKLYPYFYTSGVENSGSQIDYTEGPFGHGRYSVRLKGRTDMSNDPVVRVTWYGAVAYCNWRSQKEGKQSCYNLSLWKCDFTKNGYRLPTEAEWEYAARGGLSGKRFPWGDTISHIQANYYSAWREGIPIYAYDVNPTEGNPPTWDDGILPFTSPVGSFAPNGYGLYDMAGNAFEWCNDWFSSNYYSVSPTSNPTGPAMPAWEGGRVLRGGSWMEPALFSRVSERNFLFPDGAFDDDGFRLVLDLK